MTPPILVVAWAPDNGRSRALGEALGAQVLFATKAILRPHTAPPRYLLAAGRTWRLVRSSRPELVVVMVPPAPAALVAWLAARSVGARLAVDVHSGAVLHAKWRWIWPLVRWVCRRSTLSVVTTDALAARLRDQNVERVFALHDPPMPCITRPVAPYVLVVAGWDTDEPVQAILAAARALPEVRFRWTGAAPARLRRQTPPNVELTGWQPPAVYEQMLASAAVVACLTHSELTMQRGGYEALAAHRPLVTTATSVLRDFFGDAAVYVAPEGASLAAGIREALARTSELTQAMAALHQRQLEAWPTRLCNLRAALGLTSS
ncbi:MAG: glycosyltransferase [Mycobacteriales bacterium]